MLEKKRRRGGWKRKPAVEKNYLADAYLCYSPRTPEQKLWWSVYIAGIRDAIKARLGKNTISKRKGDSIGWINSANSNEMGSIEWIARELSINGLEQIRRLVNKGTVEELKKFLYRIN